MVADAGSGLKQLKLIGDMARLGAYLGARGGCGTGFRFGGTNTKQAQCLNGTSAERVVWRLRPWRSITEAQELDSYAGRKAEWVGRQQMEWGAPYFECARRNRLGSADDTTLGLG